MKANCRICGREFEKRVWNAATCGKEECRRENERSRDRAKRQKNPEKYRRIVRKSERKNPEKWRERSRKRQEQYPEKKRELRFLEAQLKLEGKNRKIRDLSQNERIQYALIMAIARKLSRVILIKIKNGELLLAYSDYLDSKYKGLPKFSEEFKCRFCGKVFLKNPNPNCNKYCSNKCARAFRYYQSPLSNLPPYIQARFGRLEPPPPPPELKPREGCEDLF